MAPVPGEITQKQFETVDLENVSSGEIVEAFRVEMGKVLDNILDERTKAACQRSITITLKMKPNENRTQITTETEVSTSLAKVRVSPDLFTISLGRSGNEPSLLRQRGDQITMAEESAIRLSERRR